MKAVFLCLSLVLATASVAKKRPLFAKKTIVLGGQTLTVEIADTAEKTSYGLMFRTRPLQDAEGMLFVFKSEQMLKFWTKNTFIPLSIGYFDRHRRLVSSHVMTPVTSEMEQPTFYPSEKKAMYALEVRSGWFKKYGIKKGQAFHWSSSAP